MDNKNNTQPFDVTLAQQAREEIERIKQNALFNLDFEEYKKQVKKQFKIDNAPEKYLEKIRNLRFSDDACHNKYNNTHLIIGIILIIFAFILMLFA